MANWLTRATSLFQQQPPPELEPFQVVCDCGGKVVGQRSANYQKPNCPACDRPVFVLQANVYPLPKSPAKKKSDNFAKERKLTGAASNTLVKEIPPTPVLKTSKVAPANAGQPTAPANEFQPPVRRFFVAPKLTPLRIVTFAIVVMSALTIGGLVRRSRMETAKVTVAQAADAGLMAIHDKDFAKASFEFGRARDAVDVLGRIDATANEIRQNSRETTAMAKLSSSSLSEILEETLATRKPGQNQPLQLSSGIKGTWVIFDTRFHHESKGKSNYTVDAPIQVDDVTVQIEIDSAIFKKLPWTDETGEPSRVIFAAQFEQLSAPKGEPLTSVLTLSGKTAFLWANYDSYQLIGFVAYDEENKRETRALLERQVEAQQNRK